MNTTRPEDSFTAMLHAIDARDWAGVRRAFDDQVDMDYSSLFGAPPARVNADEQVAGWQAFAGAFDATQHLTGPIIVTTCGDEVIGHAHVRAYHRITGAKGGDLWMVAGHYQVRLRQRGTAWKIAGITLTVLYQEGNRSIPEIGQARSAQLQRR